MPGPDIIIHTTIERDLVVTRDERTFTIRAPLQAGLIPHSLKLYFTVSLMNKGDESAINVVADNPIPPGTVYVVGSARAEKGTVMCSVDGENYHDEGTQLKTEGQCTDLRWLIDSLEPGGALNLEFEVVVANSDDL